MVLEPFLPILPCVPHPSQPALPVPSRFPRTQRTATSPIQCLEKMAKDASTEIKLQWDNSQAGLENPHGSKPLLLWTGASPRGGTLANGPHLAPAAKRNVQRS